MQHKDKQHTHKHDKPTHEHTKPKARTHKSIITFDTGEQREGQRSPPVFAKQFTRCVFGAKRKRRLGRANAGRLGDVGELGSRVRGDQFTVCLVVLLLSEQGRVFLFLDGARKIWGRGWVLEVWRNAKELRSENRYFATCLCESDKCKERILDTLVVWQIKIGRNEKAKKEW